MRARLVSHDMLSLLFVLRGLYNECLFEVLQMIGTELIESLCNLCDELFQNLNRNFPLFGLFLLIN
jgi:hypothetical protein